MFEAPYGVEQQPNDLMQTYLDTVGRPVVVVTANNLVEQHIQDFTVGDTHPFGEKSSFIAFSLLPFLSLPSYILLPSFLILSLPLFF